MKKKIVILGSFLLAMTIGYFCFNSEKAELSELMLINVEALASNESSGTVRCYNPGTVDCPHSKTKVEYVYEGYSLETFY